MLAARARKAGSIADAPYDRRQQREGFPGRWEGHRGDCRQGGLVVSLQQEQLFSRLTRQSLAIPCRVALFWHDHHPVWT